MTKRDDRLRLSPRAIVVLVVFVITMLIGTYFFAGYMLIGSRANEDHTCGGFEAPYGCDSGGINPMDNRQHEPGSRKGSGASDPTVVTTTPKLTPKIRRTGAK